MHLCYVPRQQSSDWLCPHNKKEEVEEEKKKKYFSQAKYVVPFSLIMVNIDACSGESISFETGTSLYNEILNRCNELLCEKVFEFHLVE